VLGDFGAVVGPRIEALGKKNVPIFLFVDPFGYTDPPPQISKRLLSFGHCEVLIFVPTAFITQFLGDPNLAGTFDNFFGSEEWRRFIGAPAAEASRGLAELFKKRLDEDATYVRSFEMVTEDKRLYHLFFATNNVRGHEKMKEAMWRVDRVGGAQFSDATIPGQEVLFSDTADLGVLERALRAKFGDADWHRYSALERFTWDETPYLPRHLKDDLRRLDKKGVRIIDEGPRGGFKPETLVLFD